jgi:hypothetical protein
MLESCFWKESDRSSLSCLALNLIMQFSIICQGFLFVVRSEILFITTKHDEGKISESILELINALIDIISIAYSPESKRYPRQILRLFNACFKFGVIAKTVFGSPKKITMRKYFGSHFHSIVSYLPVIYRIFDTNTILTEQEERGFGDIRSISERTTNRKSRQIIENCIIRFNVMLIFCRIMRQYLLILPFLLYICYVY